MRHIMIVLIVLAVPAIAHAATLKVPSQYPSIQDAIDAAVNGDTVLVAPGTYVENIDFLGKAITVKSDQGPEVTVVDGGQAGSVVTFQSNEEPDAVLDGFTITNGSGTLDQNHPEYNFMGGGIYCTMSSPTIINNIVIGNLADNSGGILCIDYSNSTIIKNKIIENIAVGNVVPTATGAGGIGVAYYSAPEILDNIISENKAVMYSGGIACGYNSHMILKGNTITKNKADDAIGGVGFAYNSTGTVKNNIISENVSATFGGGITCGVKSTILIANNIICENKAGTTGGGIACYVKSKVVATNNVLFGNSADDIGGGISCRDSKFIIMNNTLFGNDALNFGGGIGSLNDSSVDVKNTILWSKNAPQGCGIYIGSGGVNPSTLTISHSDVQGGKGSVNVEPGCTLDWGQGMIDKDPIFVDDANNDFHMTFSSPCKDSGMGTGSVGGIHYYPLDLPSTDFEGDPRIAYGAVDMGADEFYTHLYWTGDATPGGNVKLNFVGEPDTKPVFLCLGTGVLDPSIPSMWGDWYLQFPIVGPLDLGSINPPNGVLIFPGTIPGTPPPPYSIPMQALIGAKLTNLCLLNIK